MSKVWKSCTYSSQMRLLGETPYICSDLQSNNTYKLHKQKQYITNLLINLPHKKIFDYICITCWRPAHPSAVGAGTPRHSRGAHPSPPAASASPCWGTAARCATSAGAGSGCPPGHTWTRISHTHTAWFCHGLPLYAWWVWTSLGSTCCKVRIDML